MSIRIGTSFALPALFLLACQVSAQAPARPNVIFIMTDDVGYGDLSSYGATDLSTPNLDRLGAEGVRFTDFYSNGPACSPTRTGFMTGRYQQRYGIEIPIRNPAGAEGMGLAANGRTLPQLLKNAGYRTGLVGKWHLGYDDDQRPNAHGFDVYFGFKAGYSDYYQHTNGEGQPDLWENGEQIVEEGYLTDMITERAVDFIETGDDGPFFLSVQYNAAHWPYQPPDSPSVAPLNAMHVMPYLPLPSSREDYVAMLERADRGIGEIMAAVERTGQTENTLIVFTNDNGGEWLSRNAPLFNYKSTVWEGGIRVPAMMRWPGVIPAGIETDQVGITMDLTATILAVAEARVPDDLGLEGIDLLPIVTGQAPEVERTLFWRVANGPRAVRSGDWKLILEGAGRFPRAHLFNLRLDIGERESLVSTEQGRAVAQRLKPLVDAWEASVDADAELLAN